MTSLKRLTCLAVLTVSLGRCGLGYLPRGESEAGHAVCGGDSRADDGVPERARQEDNSVAGCYINDGFEKRSKSKVSAQRHSIVLRVVICTC